MVVDIASYQSDCNVWSGQPTQNVMYVFEGCIYLYVTLMIIIIELYISFAAGDQLIQLCICVG